MSHLRNLRTCNQKNLSVRNSANAHPIPKFLVSIDRYLNVPPISSERRNSKIAKPAPRPTSLPQSQVVHQGSRINNDAHKIEELNNQVADLKITIDGLEKERDFYFGKLRDIEVVCQDHGDLPVLQRVINILYATEEGFAAPEEIPEGQDVDEEY